MNYKVQITFNKNKVNFSQRTVLVKDARNDVDALTIAKAYFGPNIGYDTVLIAPTTPGMEKCITEVI
jgi:hypothetical protein